MQEALKEKENVQERKLHRKKEFMFFKILKKDLIRKRTMNIIMLLFILLASMFMGSSVNNFAVSTTAVGNFFTLANTADVVAVVAGAEEEFAAADEFLEGCTEVKDFDKDISIMGVENALYHENGESIKLASSDMGIYLLKNPNNYSLIYTIEDKPVAIQDGELAIANVLAESMDVQVGDKLTLNYSGYEKEYTVAAITKDAGFGTSLAGVGRIVMSDHDFNEIESLFPVKVAFYHVMTDDSSTMIRLIGENVSGVKNTIAKNTFTTCYIFDVMIAVIMLIVSICLLLVAFMILRFTIIFTLEDDYKEIGVLKAVGIRNRPVRELYLSKYVALAVIGAVLGCIGSIPFGALLNSSLNKNIVAVETKGYIWINILCALFVIALVVLFCYGCTKKLNRFSAIEAIRCGSKGESYTVKSKIKFDRTKRLSAINAMACNDVFGNLKRYIVLMITFFICLLLMILPMVAVDTIKNPETSLKLLGVETGGVYVYIPTREIMLKADRNYVEQYAADMEEEIAQAGYDATVNMQVFLSSKIEYPDKDGEYAINAVMNMNQNSETITAIEGAVPKLANEFALSEQAIKEFGGTIGDTYRVTVGTKTYDMILTGTYSNMNNLGKTAYVTMLLDADFSNIAALMPATVKFNGNLSEAEFEQAYQAIKELYPDYSVYDDKEYAENFMGSYIDMFNDAGKIVLLIALVIIFLVSLLISKSFVARETGETALLKSIGFANQSIRKRYILRIIICLFFSMILFYITSIPIANLMISKAFILFGAYGTTAVTNPLYIFLLYPVIVLADILIAGIFGTTAITRIDPKEVNNAE